MTRYEKMAYDFGKTFLPESADKIAPCYDPRMKNLVCEARSVQGRMWNMRNMTAWQKGVEESLGVKFDYEEE